jgi:vacuolar-type H+-ATPase subunit H
LIERLEALVANGRKLPFTNSVIVDQAEALEWIDQLRVTIPEEIKSARRVTNEVERLLEQAREEAEQILARAQEQATYLIEERELTRQAEELSHEIVRQAQLESDEVRRGADDYASEVLMGLEAQVMRTLKTIKSGLELLDDRRATAAAVAAAASTAAMDNDGQGSLDEYDESDAGQPVHD